MTWDGTDRRKSHKYGTDPVTLDDLEDALAIHSVEEKKRVQDMVSALLHAFPDGIEGHRIYHEGLMKATKSEQEFWDTAKKALITNGVNGLLSLVKVILLLAALGLTAKFALPAWASAFIIKP